MKDSFIYSHKENLYSLIASLRQQGFLLYYVEPQSLTPLIPFLFVDSTSYLEIKDTVKKFSIPTVLLYKKDDAFLERNLQEKHFYLINEELDLYFQIKNFLPSVQNFFSKETRLGETFLTTFKAKLSSGHLESKKDFFQHLCYLLDKEDGIKSFGFYFKKTHSIFGSPSCSSLKMRSLPDIVTHQNNSFLHESQMQDMAKKIFIHPQCIEIFNYASKDIFLFLEIDPYFQYKVLFIDMALNDFYKSFIARHSHELLLRNQPQFFRKDL